MSEEARARSKEVVIDSTHENGMTISKTPEGESIIIPDDVTQVYSNFAMSRFSNNDFILLFGTTNPFIQQRINTDVIVTMTPLIAKSTLLALASTIKRYEAAFGEIKGAGVRNEVNEVPPKSEEGAK